MQPDQSQPEAQQVPVSAPQGGNSEKPAPRKFNWKIPILILLILAVAGLGYWTYQLSTNLKVAQQSLAALQGRHADLTTKNDGLTTEFTQVSGDLESTNTELATTRETLKTAKSDLSKSKQDASALQSKKTKAGKFVEIMRGVFEDKDSFIETYLKVLATGDAKLSDLYNAYMKSKSSVDLFTWSGYLISKAVEFLK